jgi:hypothetical protein
MTNKMKLKLIEQLHKHSNKPENDNRRQINKHIDKHELNNDKTYGTSTQA